MSQQETVKTRSMKQGAAKTGAVIPPGHGGVKSGSDGDAITDFETFVRKSLADMQKSLDKLVTEQRDFTERLGVVERKQSDIIKRFENSDSRITETNKLIREVLQPTVSKVQVQISSILQENDRLRNKILDLERYSRGFNLRMGGVKESADDNPIAFAKQFISEKLAIPDVQIENAHRVGRQREGVDRQIIMKFLYRPQRAEVLKKSRTLLKNSSIYFTEDLPPEDKKTKDKFRELMTQAFNNGKKVRFTRGKLYINVCPQLSNLTEPPQLLTIYNLYDPRLSSYERVVDTTVTLTCATPALRLQPNNSILTCQNNFQWNGTIPKCQAIPVTTTLPPTEATPFFYMSDEQKLIIGITGGIGGFIFIILVILIVAIFVLQIRAKQRQADKERLRAPGGTEMTSISSLYAMDKRQYGVDRGYNYYPPTYSSRDHYLGRENGRPNLAPLALPTPSHAYDVYNNPAYRNDEDGVMVHGRKNELLDVIARERIDQLNYDRERYTKGGYYGGDMLGAEASQREGKRYAKRGPRSPEAAVRAQRTLQYVEDHSSSSPTPSYLGQGPYLGEVNQAQKRYDDRFGQGMYFEDRRDQNRYLDEYPGQSRVRDDTRGEGRYQDNYERRYLSNPRDGGQYSRDIALPERDYPTYPDMRDTGNLQMNRLDASRYAPMPGRELISDGKLWRPPTKTHFTGKRYR